jgi:glucan biosynthesis protein C
MTQNKRYSHLDSCLDTCFSHASIFFLAGFFTETLRDKRGSVEVVKQRLRRVVFPFVVFFPPLLGIVNLITMSHAKYLDVQSVGWKKNWQFSAWQLETGHLWFLYYLGVFSIFTVLVQAIGRGLVSKVLYNKILNGFKCMVAGAWYIPILSLPGIALGQTYEFGIIRGDGAFLPQISSLTYYYVFDFLAYYSSPSVYICSNISSKNGCPICFSS